MITYRKDLDLMSIVVDIAQRIQDEVDQQALDKAAATLAKFWYEKVVRCRDCRYADWDITAYWCTRNKHAEFEIGELGSKPGGFCAWGERKAE